MDLGGGFGIAYTTQDDPSDAAQLAIENAEQDRVADHAPAELRDAREDLAAARSAVQDEDMVLARRLAEQSRANAELASAKAEEAAQRLGLSFERRLTGYGELAGFMSQAAAKSEG